MYVFNQTAVSVDMTFLGGLPNFLGINMTQSQLNFNVNKS